MTRRREQTLAWFRRTTAHLTVMNSEKSQRQKKEVEGEYKHEDFKPRVIAEEVASVFQFRF